MTLHISDIAGMIGVIMVLAAYARVQMNPDFARRVAYPLLNGMGAFLIVLSLLRDWNLSAFVIEAAWVVVSFYGVWRRLCEAPEAQPSTV